MNEKPLRCLLIFDEPAAGLWNMAVDEALLQQAPLLDSCVLRFYRWAEPTLSLGYFQNYAQRHSHKESNACPLVRRSSGGGAIVHDQELTYSLIVPKRVTLAKQTRQLYELTHKALQESLAAFAVTRTQMHPAEQSEPMQSAPFLCSQRRSEFDLLLQADQANVEKNAESASMAKICGSAQRRAKESILQHGSILLARSAAAPQLSGIFELSGIRIDPVVLQATFADRIAKKLGFQYELSSHCSALHKLAEEIRTTKYASSVWNEKR